MTDNTIDLAKRVAEALSRTEVSGMDHADEFNSDIHVPLGEVPLHLRGLGALVGQMAGEMVAAERRLRATQRDFKIIQDLFSKALQPHIQSPGAESPIVGITLYGDWKVAGVRRRSAEEIVDEVLQGMGFRRK